MKYLYFSSLLLATLSAPVLASAAPFQPNNIVVARVGDGSGALTPAATAVFLDEYTPAGQLVQSIALPTSVTGNNRILTASGTATAELSLTRSVDGHYLVLAGYGAAPGTTSVSISATADVARVIALIGADGNVDTSTSPGADAFDGSSIRAAATADGSSFYSVGGNSGVRYQAFGSVVSTQLTTAPTAARAIGLGPDNNLYFSTNASPYVGLSQVGTGLPTAAGQPVTVLPGFPGTAAGASPYSFYFADLSPAVPGVDVVYVADDRTTGGGIQKWSLVGGSWVLSGTIAGSASAAVRGLGGSTSGTAVALAATSANGLIVVADNAGYNAAPSVVALPTAVATPGTSTAFRGVAMAPVALAPTIASFTPTTGGPGTTITITGTNLTGATAVSIGGLAISGYTVVSATSITLFVPASSTGVSGPLTVVTPGGTAISATSFSLALAAAASQALPGLALYPNPATDYVQVSLPQAGPATVALRDLTGRQVLAPQPLPASQRLRLPASLAAGIYLLEVRQGSETAVRRIEKK
ncbi:MAG: T9SS type A sorting domain-containing protein [Janthinobacterium lividum]